MSKARTGAERYFEERRKDAGYAKDYAATRRRIDQIDSLVRGMDQRRSTLDLSKAELARRANLRPEVVRRLFAAECPNPTLSTLVALAQALEIELIAEPTAASQVS